MKAGSEHFCLELMDNNFPYIFFIYIFVFSVNNTFFLSFLLTWE